MSDKTVQTLKIFSSVFQFLFSTHKAVSYGSKFTLVALLMLKKRKSKRKMGQVFKGSSES